MNRGAFVYLKYPPEVAEIAAALRELIYHGKDSANKLEEAS